VLLLLLLPLLLLLIDNVDDIGLDIVHSGS